MRYKRGKKNTGLSAYVGNNRLTSTRDACRTVDKNFKILGVQNLFFDLKVIYYVFCTF